MSYTGSWLAWNGNWAVAVGLTSCFRGPRKLPWFLHVFLSHACIPCNPLTLSSCTILPALFSMAAEAAAELIQTEEEAKITSNNIKTIRLRALNCTIFCSVICVLLVLCVFGVCREGWMECVLYNKEVEKGRVTLLRLEVKKKMMKPPTLNKLNECMYSVCIVCVENTTSIWVCLIIVELVGVGWLLNDSVSRLESL